jgi:hypothetical protein
MVPIEVMAGFRSGSTAMGTCWLPDQPDSDDQREPSQEPSHGKRPVNGSRLCRLPSASLLGLLSLLFVI